MGQADRQGRQEGTGRAAVYLAAALSLLPSRVGLPLSHDYCCRWCEVSRLVLYSTTLIEFAEDPMRYDVIGRDSMRVFELQQMGATSSDDICSIGDNFPIEKGERAG